MTSPHGKDVQERVVHLSRNIGMEGGDFAMECHLFVSRFYGPVNPMGLCRMLSGIVLLVVNQYCAHSFARNWQLPFLNQWKGENDRRKHFVIKSPWKNLADFFWLCWGSSTRQPLWVILCCLPEKGRREMEETVEEMKERDRGERKMNDSEETEEIKTFPLSPSGVAQATSWSSQTRIILSHWAF